MNRLTNMRRSKGFTLIELMLAMTFISILLLTIALTIVQIATIYNRGIIAKEVNVSSRAISTELNLALTSSGSFSLNPTDHRYVENADGGRLCVGAYSYIWNYTAALSPAGTYPNPTPSPTRNIYVATAQPNLSANVVKIGGTATRYEIALVKVPDASGAYCVPTASTASGYPDVPQAGATELLRTGDYGIVLYSLHVDSSATATDVLSGQQLYKITFVLGTPDINATTGTKDTTVCKAPDVVGSDTNYCSVEKFTLVVRVVNGVN